MSFEEQLKAENSRLTDRIRALENQNLGLLKRIKNYEDLKGIYSNIVTFLNSEKSSAIYSETKDEDGSKYK